MNRFLKFVKNNRTALLSGFAIIAVLVIVIIFEYIGLGSASKESILASSFWVLVLVVMLVTFVNLSATKKREKQVEKKLGISDTLINCITALTEEQDIDKAVDRLLKILNDYFDGDRAYLFEIDYEKQVTNNSYEYAAEGVTKEIDMLQNIPLEVIDSWIHKFKETGMFFITSLDKDVDKDSDTYRILEMQQIESLIAVPLIENGVIIGFLGIDNPKVNCDDLTLLSSATFFILDSIDRRESHAALQKISFEDGLTGVYNRNKFNAVLDEKNKCFINTGIAYFDINGLKEMNDTKGHSAGDLLIKNAAESINEVFKGDTYRIGGDEFVVIHQGVESAAFDEMVSAVITGLSAKGISLSCGTTWTESTCDIEQQMSVADKLMYDDKTRFYEAKNN
ncbi:MAG: GGDEF domain-containing protein [Clostridia bacterium]|nr:GGDEF domain-containing protein [Clostridia bacterium]